MFNIPVEAVGQIKDFSPSDFLLTYCLHEIHKWPVVTTHYKDLQKIGSALKRPNPMNYDEIHSEP